MIVRQGDKATRVSVMSTGAKSPAVFCNLRRIRLEVYFPNTIIDMASGLVPSTKLGVGRVVKMLNLIL